VRFRGLELRRLADLPRNFLMMIGPSQKAMIRAVIAAAAARKVMNRTTPKPGG
jgi:hypothetical protein